MKILFFCYLPIPHPNAAWRRIEFFTDYLQNKGHEVSVAGAFSYKSRSKAGLIRWNGIRVINLTPFIWAANLSSLIFNTLSSIFTSIIPFILVRPKIVIISVPPGEAAIGSYLLAKMLGTKVVIDYRDLWEDSLINVVHSRANKVACKYLKVIMNICYRHSDLVITVNEDLATNLSLRGVKNAKIVTNGADCRTFRPSNKQIARSKMGFDKDDFILVYSGTIGLYYRLDVIVRTLKTVVRTASNIRLLMVGYGQSVKQIMALTKELGLEDNVSYLGEILDKHKLVELLSASDVGVIPYDSDPKWVNLKSALPAKAFEYFACGLPVIATVDRNSSIGKFITEYKIGLISNPENEVDLAKNIEIMHSDIFFRTEAGKRAIYLVEERFDRNKIAENLRAMLEGLVNV